MKCKPYCKDLTQELTCVKCGKPLDVDKIAKGIYHKVTPEEAKRIVKIFEKAQEEQ